jgi:hypothetical protein
MGITAIGVEPLVLAATGWDSLTPARRNQRIAGLQQQVTKLQNEVQNLPPEQRPEVRAMLGLAVVRLADILRKTAASTGYSVNFVAHRCVSLARSGTVPDSHRNDATPASAEVGVYAGEHKAGVE